MSRVAPGYAVTTEAFAAAVNVSGPRDRAGHAICKASPDHLEKPVRDAGITRGHVIVMQPAPFRTVSCSLNRNVKALQKFAGLQLQKQLLTGVTLACVKAARKNLTWAISLAAISWATSKPPLVLVQVISWPPEGVAVKFPVPAEKQPGSSVASAFAIHRLYDSGRTSYIRSQPTAISHPRIELSFQALRMNNQVIREFRRATGQNSIVRAWQALRSD